MFKVVKRDGETDDFNLAKIRGAIEKAFKATGKEYTEISRTVRASGHCRFSV